MLAFSEVFCDAVLKHARLCFEENTHICKSRCVARAETNELA